jgi:hypothetical protein
MRNAPRTLSEWFEPSGISARATLASEEATAANLLLAFDADTQQKLNGARQRESAVGQEHLRVDGRDVCLVRGMSDAADLLLGEKRVLEYMLQPVQRCAREGMRER